MGADVNVYIVTTGSSEDVSVAGVFSTEEKARKFVVGLRQFSGWTISRQTVDAEYAYMGEHVAWEQIPPPPK